MMKQSKYTIGCLASFILTIFLSKYVIWVGVPIIILINIIFIRYLNKKFFVYTVISGLLGVGIVFLSIHRTDQYTIDYYNNKYSYSEITGQICEEPNKKNSYFYYVICTESINSIPVAGKVYTKLEAEYDYGDTVIVRGRLGFPYENFKNYLVLNGIYSVLYKSTSRLIKKDTAKPNYKDIFEARLNRLYTPVYSAFMAGLLIGSKKNIPDSILSSFKQTGLTHILAISGFNISIIILIINKLLFFLPRILGFYISVICIIVFTVFVGGSSSVVRAAVMGVLGLIAYHTGNKINSLISILLTASLMIAFNPNILWYDLGFLLSFSAVFGIIYISPFLRFKYIPKFIEEPIKITIAAQITTLPIIIYNFQILSVVSPISNLLAGPAIPFAMLFGFVSVILSFNNFFLIFSYISKLFLQYIIFVSEILSLIPGAYIYTTQINIVFVIIYYLILAYYVISKNLKILDP